MGPIRTRFGPIGPGLNWAHEETSETCPFVKERGWSEYYGTLARDGETAFDAGAYRARIGVWCHDECAGVQRWLALVLW